MIRGEEEMADEHRSIGDLPVYSQNELTVKQLAAAMDTIQSNQRAMAEQIELIRRAVMGNGDPSHSILMRLDRVENTLTEYAAWRRFVDGRYWALMVMSIVLLAISAAVLALHLAPR